MKASQRWPWCLSTDDNTLTPSNSWQVVRTKAMRAMLCLVGRRPAEHRTCSMRRARRRASIPAPVGPWPAASRPEAAEARFDRLRARGAELLHGQVLFARRGVARSVLDGVAGVSAEHQFAPSSLATGSTRARLRLIDLPAS